MKKGISIWSFAETNLEKCFSLAKDAGFDGVEVALDTVGEINLNSTEKDMSVIRKNAEKAGVALYSVASGLYWKQNYTQADEQNREKAIAITEKQLQIAFNPSPFTEDLLKLPLHQVKWWLCNEIEGGQLTGKSDPEEILISMQEKFPGSSIVLTLGKDGCMFTDGKQVLRQPIFPVKAVDTTAAGDTFTGFFLASVAEGKAVADALRIASRASSIAVSRMGASSSVPTLAEVLAAEAE